MLFLFPEMHRTLSRVPFSSPSFCLHLIQRLCGLLCFDEKLERSRLALPALLAFMPLPQDRISRASSQSNRNAEDAVFLNMYLSYATKST